MTCDLYDLWPGVTCDLVWPVTSMTCDLYDLWPLWPVTSMTCDLYNLWPLWPVTYMTCDLYDLWPLTCDLYDLWPIWPVTSMTCDLVWPVTWYDLWPLCPVTSITCDLYDLCDLVWPVTSMTCHVRWRCAAAGQSTPTPGQSQQEVGPEAGLGQLQLPNWCRDDQHGQHLLPQLQPPGQLSEELPRDCPNSGRWTVFVFVLYLYLTVKTLFMIKWLFRMPSQC